MLSFLRRRPSLKRADGRLLSLHLKSNSSNDRPQESKKASRCPESLWSSTFSPVRHLRLGKVSINFISPSVVLWDFLRFKVISIFEPLIDSSTEKSSYAYSKSSFFKVIRHSLRIDAISRGKSLSSSSLFTILSF
jgi:hypothetical protein